MTATPLVSIGCAVYNGAATLERALAGLVDQDYPNLEILISDDGSTDASIQICEDLARRDPRVKFQRNPRNLGIIGNFNGLIDRATGKYFMWADQDDVRDRTFVGKAVARLEADHEAVLCHSYTGVFIGDPSDLKYIITLHGVRDETSPVRRYYKFLRCFSDTTIYGLIRLDALKHTHRFRTDLGSAGILLFEQLLAGKFIEIPEVLYWYSARGVRNRPAVAEEYARSNPGKKLPRFYFPFLVVAKHQTNDIAQSALPISEKLALGTVLWGHTSAVALTKLVYRTLSLPLKDRMPDWFTRVCDDIVEGKEHLKLLGQEELDEDLFPRAWTLKGGE
ncbi:MAG: glycosyl transferase, family 2 [Labilithrix sp.]|nr:glycosyl transferase, family 2 [Labilithrix sp.]